ncbi:MAG: spondin domain-containing protein [Acidimicrobiales bacterium]
MRRRRLATIGIAGLALPAVLGVGGAQAQPPSAPLEVSAAESATPTYTVTFRNLTDGQWLTPPNWAAHDRSVAVFERNRPASEGVRAVAENGGVPVLAAELQAAVDKLGNGVSGVGATAPIGPGGEVSWTFSTDERRFSLVSMLICTNDGFGGIDATPLPKRDGRARTIPVRAYDAGTEVNTERHDDLVPAPFCGGGGLGTDQSDPALAQDGVIRRHRGIRGVGDLGPEFDWRGPVAEITIERG